MSNRRRSFLLLWMAPFTGFMGVLAFYSVASNPRFETFHALDVIRLMTAGAGFAVALIMLILFFIPGPRSEDKRAREKVVRSQIEEIPGRTSRFSRRGRQNGFSWHDFFPAGPAAELGR